MGVRKVPGDQAHANNSNNFLKSKYRSDLKWTPAAMENCHTDLNLRSFYLRKEKLAEGASLKSFIRNCGEVLIKGAG